jgi:hypothetical protein
VQNNRFLPLTNEFGTFPAPNPIGSHAHHENAIYQNVHFLDNLVLDPIEWWSINDAEDAPISGIIHFAQTQGVWIANNEFRQTQPRINRVIGFFCYNTGNLASGDPNVATPTPGTFATPALCGDIWIRDNRFYGFKPRAAAAGETVNQQQHIWLRGNAAARMFNVHVDGNHFYDAYGDATTPGTDVIHAKHVDGLWVEGNSFEKANGCTYTIGCTGVHVINNEYRQVNGYLWYSSGNKQLFLSGNNVTGFKLPFQFDLNSADITVGPNVYTGGTTHALVFSGSTRFTVSGQVITNLGANQTNAMRVVGSATNGRVVGTIATGYTTAVDVASAGANVAVISTAADTPTTVIGGQVGKSWDDFTGGFAVHRTGGAVPYMLPASASAIEACIASGQTFIDLDLRWNNNTLWVAHDDSLTATSSADGLIRNTSSAVMAHIRHLASKTTGGSYQDESFLELGDALDRYAHRVLITVEPKNQISNTDWQKSIDLLAPEIISRGLQRSVVIGFGGPDLATVQDKANIVKQYPGLLWNPYVVTGDAGVNDLSYVTAVADLGAYMIGLPLGSTQAYVDAWKARGVKVITFVGRRSDIPKMATLGINASNGDYAIYAHSANAVIKRAYWANGYWGTGDIPASGHERPILEPDGLLFTDPVSNYQWMMAGDFAPLPSAFTLNIKIKRVGSPVSGSGWLGVNVCASTDASFTSSPTPSTASGYTCFITPSSGGVSIVDYTAGVGTTRANSATGAVAIPEGNTYTMRVVVSSTNVTVSQRDDAGVLIGPEVTYANTTWRGGWLHVGGLLGSAAENCAYKVMSLIIT